MLFFDLILSCTVYEEKKASISLEIDQHDAPGTLHFKYGTATAPNGFAEYTTTPEGIPQVTLYCAFTAEGAVYLQSLSKTHSYDIFICEYRFAGVACSLGMGESVIRGGIID